MIHVVLAKWNLEPASSTSRPKAHHSILYACILCIQGDRRDGIYESLWGEMKECCVRLSLLKPGERVLNRTSGRCALCWRTQRLVSGTHLEILNVRGCLYFPRSECWECSSSRNKKYFQLWWGKCDPWKTVGAMLNLKHCAPRFCLCQ